MQSMPEKMTATEFDELLIAATVRMKEESVTLRERNRALREYLERRQQFAQRLTQTLTDLKAEQEHMDTEARRLLSAEEFASLAAPQGR